MTTRNFNTGILIICVALFGGVAGYYAANYLASSKHNTEMKSDEKVPYVQSKKEPEVLYWYDPMYPQNKFDKPGKSPFMDMPLVPKYADETDDAASVKIDPAMKQNIGIRLATVTRGSFAIEISATGTVAYNERDVAVVQSRTNGFVERVYARAPGDLLKAGAPLADILVPDWAAAQTEFLVLLNTGETGLIDAARTRLKLLGMSAALIKHIEDGGKTQPVITIFTPISGVIQTLDVRAGMTVNMGQTIASINGLKTVWLNVAVPVAHGGLVSAGDQAEAILSVYPGEIFTGEVIALLPEINIDSRTLRVRIELDNDDARLRPGMYAEVILRRPEQQPVLLVPSEAVIRTGQRALVILAGDDGQYKPVEIETGHEANGQTVILKGLEEGQQVVASGQFLIDSEANLQGIMSRTGGETETGDKP